MRTGWFIEKVLAIARKGNNCSRKMWRRDPVTGWRMLFAATYETCRRLVIIKEMTQRSIRFAICMLNHIYNQIILSDLRALFAWIHSDCNLTPLAYVSSRLETIFYFVIRLIAESRWTFASPFGSPHAKGTKCFDWHGMRAKGER